MTLLSSDINELALTDLLKKSDKEAIANFVKQRFTERYIEPIKKLDRTEKHGFGIMAICCLMIESLESFKNGWESTRGKSEQAFQQFLTRESNFAVFKEHASQFYKHVRCGILHQSETTDGWKIRRDNKLFDLDTKTINASDFLKRLENTLDQYVERLKHDDWDSECWKNLRKKLKKIIENCG